MINRLVIIMWLMVCLLCDYVIWCNVVSLWWCILDNCLWLLIMNMWRWLF